MVLENSCVRFFFLSLLAVVKINKSLAFLLLRLYVNNNGSVLFSRCSKKKKLFLKIKSILMFQLCEHEHRTTQNLREPDYCD